MYRKKTVYSFMLIMKGLTFGVSRIIIFYLERGPINATFASLYFLIYIYNGHKIQRNR